MFVDTSAIMAVVVAGDREHDRAAQIFGRLRAEDRPLATTSYVLIETYALLDRRCGRAAVMAFREGFASLLEVDWVGEELHQRGLDLMTDAPADVSLVDCVSFAWLRENRVDEVFAFDRHFAERGFGDLAKQVRGKG